MLVFCTGFYWFLLEKQFEGDGDDEEEEEGGADLTYQFPTRRPRRKWWRQAAILNLKRVADKLVNKSSDEVVTLGFGVN